MDSQSVNQSRPISSDEALRIYSRSFPPQAGEKTGCCCLLGVSFRMQVPDVGMETAGAVAFSNFSDMHGKGDVFMLLALKAFSMGK